MLTTVPLNPHSIEDYRAAIGDAAMEELRRLAEPLRGARVLHINATSYGGGVAEILSSAIPLWRDLGLDASWQVITGTPAFFEVTKSMHNALQGMSIPWSRQMAATWWEVNEANAAALDGAYDVVVVHDPQPAGLLAAVRENHPGALGAKWVWRCHLDTTDALPEVWDFVRGHVEGYDAAVFTLPQYIKEPLNVAERAIIWPAIDPLSVKNADISPLVVREVLARYDIDPDRPLIAQISRFDPWKDPLGVIDVYRLLRQERPDLQLLMVASMAHDDPEGWTLYERIMRKAGEDFDIHILTNLNGVGNLEVNAFQRAAQVVFQKSIREGFGLVVSEALWKGAAFVGSHAGGIPMQLDGGRAGVIAGDTEDFALRIGQLLDDPDTRRRLGAAGRDVVRERYLTTRLMADHMRLWNKVLGNTVPNGAGAPSHDG
jgi:trehalose synthase